MGCTRAHIVTSFIGLEWPCTVKLVDFPVKQPTAFEIIVTVRTVEALGPRFRKRTAGDAGQRVNRENSGASGSGTRMYVARSRHRQGVQAILPTFQQFQYMSDSPRLPGMR